MKQKKIFSLIFAILLMCQLCSPAMAEEKSAYQRGLEVLLASGWTLEDVENFYLPEDVELFALCGPAISTSEKYYQVSADGTSEVSKATCLAAVQTQQAASKSGIATVSDIGDSTIAGNGYLRYVLSVYPQPSSGTYVLELNFTWLIVPPERHTDAVALTFSDGLTRQGVSSNITTRYYATITEFNGSTTTTSTYSASPSAFSGSYGAGFGFELVGDTISEMYSRTASNHRGFIMYTVQPNGSTYTSAAQGFYAHQHSVFNWSASFSLDGTSLSVTPENKFTMMLPNPYCSFNL